jgi:hypothetical protein
MAAYDGGERSADHALILRWGGRQISGRAQYRYNFANACSVPPGRESWLNTFRLKTANSG